MKILFISDASDLFGAPKALMENLKNIIQLEQRNITPIVLTSKYNEVNIFCDKLNIENYVTCHPTWMMTKKEKKYKFIIKFIVKYIKYIFFSKFAIKKAEKYINFEEIDIIHTNTSIIDFGAKLAKKYNKKHIWHLREFGQEDYDMIAFKRNYIEYMNENTYSFIAISNAVKDCWIQKGIIYEKISLIYDGINLDDIKLKRKCDNKKIKVVFSGYISESKGQIQAIKAIEKMNKETRKMLQMDIIGIGKKEYMNDLIDYVNSNNLSESIKFLGYKKNLRELLPEYDIGMMCSKSEGFGRTTVEYMASGLIVVASDTGANLELINDTKDGYIYQYNNIENLKEILINVIREYSKLECVRNNAVNKVKSMFDSKLNIQKLIDKYKTCEDK